MALSKENRISMSKKILLADEELAANGMNQIAVTKRVESIQKEDDSNRFLLTLKASHIQSYEDEIKFIDGSPRTLIDEAEYQKAVKRLVGNYLLPSDNNTPIPSVPTGVWSKFTPFYLSGAIGKGYNEQPNPLISDYEESLVPGILADITTLEAFPMVKRVTGQKCVDGVPPAQDSLVPDPDVQTAMTSLKDKVNKLLAVLNSEKNALSSNPDTQNASQIAAAISQIDTTILAINTWLAFPDFNPLLTIGSCPLFNSYNISTLIPTKGYSAQLDPLKTSIATRSTFIATRKAQIATVLGTVTQDVNTGYILTATGLYGERANIINTRLNVMTGSLSRLNSSGNGANALEQEAQSIISNKNVLSSYLTTAKLSSVTNGTSFITVTSANGFVVGQKGYVVSDTQEEVEVVIQSINGNSLQLNKSLPPTYRPTELARFYVDKT